MRADLVAWIRAEKARISSLASAPGSASASATSRVGALSAMDADFQALLSAWFTPNNLNLERVTIDASPKTILERIMKHEKVHPVQDFEHLKVRTPCVCVCVCVCVCSCRAPIRTLFCTAYLCKH